MATLLLIEDDEIARSVLASTLKLYGYEVIEAVDGAQGLKLLRAPAIEGVITDIFMPEKDGIEVLMELKRQRSELKVLVISGGGRIGAVQILDAAKHLGAKKTLLKPFSTEELIAAVRELWPEEASLSVKGAAERES